LRWLTQAWNGERDQSENANCERGAEGCDIQHRPSSYTPANQGVFVKLNRVKLNQTMPISKDLLDILVCPLCKAPVELKQDQSGLKCVQCKRVYPIRDEIPVMLIDEAKVEE